MSSSASLTSPTPDSFEMDMDTADSPPSRIESPFTEEPILMGSDSDRAIVVDTPSIGFPKPAMIIDHGNDGDEDEEFNPTYKRKRPSVNYNLDDSVHNGQTTLGTPPVEHAVKRARSATRVRGVILGVWTDSGIEDVFAKHAIYGFIDVNDRLRTRLYNIDREGGEIPSEHAVTGVGGCWVTLERITFDAHLAGLTPAELKEYVKIQMNAPASSDDGGGPTVANSAVVSQAKSAVAAQEGLPPVPKVIVRRRPRTLNNRSPHIRDTPPRISGFQAVNAAGSQSPKPKPLPLVEKPSGVLLGYWADSSEPLEADKHAMYGVLSDSDCFRVKVQKQTRDGRPVHGNIPVGAGSMWVSYDKVILDPHLASLERPEVKEYCRIRLQDFERRESDNERRANELKAVQKAKAIVAEQKINGRLPPDSDRRSPEIELRHSARSESRQQSRQQAAIDEAAALLAQREKAEAVEREHEKARKEVALAEAALKTPNSDFQAATQHEFKRSINKLEKVWIAQQVATSTPGAMSPAPAPPVDQDVKYHHGIKYERKQNGPFQGKLVNAPQILSIDGEDFVEYRVLMKPY